MRIMWEPGYDFDNNKKMAESFTELAQHYRVWLQDIEQTFGCNMLKTLY